MTREFERLELAHFPRRAYDGFPAHSFRTRAEPRAGCDSSSFFARAGARSACSRMGRCGTQSALKLLAGCLFWPPAVLPGGDHDSGCEARNKSASRSITSAISHPPSKTILFEIKAMGRPQRLETREIVPQKSILIPVSQKLAIQTICER
jgi:hypothetical protein